MHLKPKTGMMDHLHEGAGGASEQQDDSMEVQGLTPAEFALMASEIEGDKVGNIVNRIRLGCTAGALIAELDGENKSNSELDALSATGVYLRENLADAMEIIVGAQRVVLHDFDPKKSGEYLDRCRQYFKKFSEINEDGAVSLGGPGMMTVLNHLDDLVDLMQTRIVGVEKYMQWNEILSDEGKEIVDETMFKKALEQLFDQPVIVRVSSERSCMCEEIFELVKRDLVGGFIFDDADKLELFKDYWLANGQGMPIPHVIFEGTSDEISEFFAAGHTCDGYMSSDLAQEGVDKVRNDRIDALASREETVRTNGFEVSDSRPIRIAVIDLQGAARLEAEMFEIANEMATIRCDLHIVYAENARQIDAFDPDLVVLPGGWHHVQHELYKDPRLDIWGAIERHLDRGGHAYFSCAGAILVRKESKRFNDGCRKGTATGLMDIGVKNDQFNGEMVIDTKMNGSKESWKPSKANFVGAPEFGSYGDQVTPIARTQDDAVVAVEQRHEGGGMMVASSTHNLGLAARTLGHIKRGLIDQEESRAASADHGARVKGGVVLKGGDGGGGTIGSDGEVDCCTRAGAMVSVNSRMMRIPEEE